VRASVARAIRMAQSWRAEVTVSNTSLFSGGAPFVGARVSCHPIRMWPRHQQPAVISIYHIRRALRRLRAQRGPNWVPTSGCRCWEHPRPLPTLPP